MSKLIKMSILILLLSLNLFGCKKEPVALPIESDVKNISLSKNIENEKVPTIISNDKEINHIIKSIQLGSKKTNKESHNDTPTNVNHYIKIKFYFFDGGASVAYLYKKRDNNYIEQPYNGIWKITPESYDNIIGLLNM
ncbi:DUF5301 domain-containing protein [Carnobacterium sp. TMP28]|uniref:DUF5301 domain-containing protein n=1 Tax=Carnobacterium sp. TMP28 TaxID=3397060 RepID=UPI0039E00C4F